MAEGETTWQECCDGPKADSSWVGTTGPSMAKHRALDSSGSGGGRVVADRGTGGAPQQDFQELLSGFPDRTAASAGPPFQGAADAV